LFGLLEVNCLHSHGLGHAELGLESVNPSQVDVGPVSINHFLKKIKKY